MSIWKMLEEAGLNDEESLAKGLEVDHAIEQCIQTLKHTEQKSIQLHQAAGQSEAWLKLWRIRHGVERALNHLEVCRVEMDVVEKATF